MSNLSDFLGGSGGFTTTETITTSQEWPIPDGVKKVRAIIVAAGGGSGTAGSSSTYARFGSKGGDSSVNGVVATGGEGTAPAYSSFPTGQTIQLTNNTLLNPNGGPGVTYAASAVYLSTKGGDGEIKTVILDVSAMNAIDIVVGLGGNGGPVPANVTNTISGTNGGDGLVILEY